MKKRILSAVLTGVLLVGLVLGVNYEAVSPIGGRLDFENATAQLSLIHISEPTRP